MHNVEEPLFDSNYLETDISYLMAVSEPLKLKLFFSLIITSNTKIFI